MLIIGLTIAEALTKLNTGICGLLERLIAATAAAAIAVLAIGILRRSRDMGGSEPGATNELGSFTVKNLKPIGDQTSNIWKRMTDAHWKVVALIMLLVAVVVIILLLLGVNHQGYSSPRTPSVSSLAQATDGVTARSPHTRR